MSKISIEVPSGSSFSASRNADLLKEALRTLPAMPRILMPVAMGFSCHPWEEARLAEDFFGGGTLPPAARASDNPIAIACLRLLTFFPGFPLFHLAAFISFITFLTFSHALFPYL